MADKISSERCRAFSPPSPVTFATIFFFFLLSSVKFHSNDGFNGSNGSVVIAPILNDVSCDNSVGGFKVCSFEVDGQCIPFRSMISYFLFFGNRASVYLYSFFFSFFMRSSLEVSKTYVITIYSNG